MRSTVAIYFDEPGKLGYPFGDPLYYQTYQDFSKYADERNMQVMFVRGTSYQGNMCFRDGWQFQGDELEEVPGPIQADLIYVKGINYVLQTDPGDLVINPPEFDRLARDKWQTYQVFHDFMPKTFAIDHSNFQEVIAQISSDRVVLKPIRGTGGKGILIADKETLDAGVLEADVPYIAQEFIDSSGGIPGLCEGYHDLRLILFNGEPKLSYLRMPQPGKLLSNIALGASARVVDIDDVPKQILELSHRVDNHYQNYTPRMYSTDFFMADGKAYLIETNARPGFNVPFMERFYEYLHQLFDESIRVHSLGKQQ